MLGNTSIDPGGVVKRFQVDVGNANGQDGLQIVLKAEVGAPFLNGLRVLRADPPRIENIILKGSNWRNGVDYSYADVVPGGNQLKPMYRSGANRIEVHFDGPVNLANANLAILGDNRTPISSSPPNITSQLLSYNATSHTATWGLSSALPSGKYALQLTGVTGANGVALDAEWMNLVGPPNGAKTADNFLDDPKDRRLLSGDGVTNAGPSTFEFWFSVLPGDRNQDGLVNSADLSTSGDVNGDGSSNPTDTAIVQGIITANTAVSLPLRDRLVDYTLRGDYNDDDRVDVLDYAVFKATFGTTQLNADGNGNGIVDAGDYNPYRDNLGKFSAWTGSGSGAGGGSGGGPIFDPNNVPRVANVTISGSQSVHAPFSFNGPNDSTDFDGSGIQLRTVPVGWADTISITFTEDVNITADTLKLTGMRTANRPTLADFHYDLGTMTASWRFTNWALGDQYLISLSDAVTDVEGNALDGEWTNPTSLFTVNSLVSEFPSGDGYAGGNFNFVATLLPGDANLDLIVDGADLLILASYYNLHGALFTHGDFNGDGTVNSTDVSIMYANFSLNLTNLSLLADLNGDWKVDDNDLNTLAANAGTSNPTHAQGNLDGDSDIDIHDLDLMFAQYGLELEVVS